MSVELKIVCFEDIFQYEAGEKSRFSDEYRQLSAVILLDKQDMASLGVKDGDKVLVENEISKIVVAAKSSDEEPHAGLAFMINSVWSNQLLRDDLCNASVPGFKGITAKVGPSQGEVTRISEIVQRLQA
jgi:formylmethanofuran dehydrogenase subunit D